MLPEKIRIMFKITETNDREAILWYFFCMCKNIQEMLSIALVENIGQK